MRVRVKVRVRIMVRVKFRVRVWDMVKVMFRVGVRVRVRVRVRIRVRVWIRVQYGKILHLCILDVSFFPALRVANRIGTMLRLKCTTLIKMIKSLFLLWPLLSNKKGEI